MKTVFRALKTWKSSYFTDFNHQIFCRKILAASLWDIENSHLMWLHIRWEPFFTPCFLSSNRWLYMSYTHQIERKFKKLQNRKNIYKQFPPYVKSHKVGIFKQSQKRAEIFCVVSFHDSLVGWTDFILNHYVIFCLWTNLWPFLNINYHMITCKMTTPII